MHLDAAEIRERIRESLPIEAVAEHGGLTLKRDGQDRWLSACPFHAESSPSFVIGGGGSSRRRAHCFGCGWDGDIFALWQGLKDCDYPQALKDLAALAGIPMGGVIYEAPRRAPRRTPEKPLASDDEKDSVKPSLPPLRMLRPAECVQLAQVRGLSVEAIRYAAFVAKRIGACMWPQYQAFHGWDLRSTGAWPSWLVTDETRNVAEFRRLDGEKYPETEQRNAIKAWSTRGKNWPIGAASMGDKVGVLWVEGGPDLLAAYHFLLRWGMQDHVAVVSMLGTSNRIRPGILHAFRGKRIRLMMDADELKEKRRKRRDGTEYVQLSRPGADAAAKWMEQLTSAGAAVEAFDLQGLVLPDGSPVKDLNDLARCDRDVTDAPEIREAFRVWDF